MSRHTRPGNGLPGGTAAARASSKRTMPALCGFAAAVVLLAMTAAGVAAESPSAADAASEAATQEHRLDNLPEEQAPMVGDPVGDAELQDLSRLADQKGISVEQAVADYAWRFDFSILAAHVRELAPDAYTYAEASGPRTAEIWFSGALPRDAVVLLDDFTHHFPDIAVEVRTEIGLNETEINSALTSAHFAVVDVVGDAVSRFDYRTLQIRVVVPGSAADRVEELSSIAQGAVSDALPSGDTDVKVTIGVSSFEQISEDDTSSSHYGGEALTSCSSGPAFINTSTGARRGSTAGHCESTQSDDGDSLTETDDYDDYWGDWQLHYGPDAESDNFYSGSATTTEVYWRDTASGGVAVTGQALCKNGKATHKTCADVTNPGICTGGNCYLIEMEEDMGDPGDSGGVVFYSYTVYGNHEGAYRPWPWSEYRGTFSRQDSVHEIWNNWYLATT